MAVSLALGSLRQIATLQTPTSTADWDGGYTETWADLTPGTWWCAIEKASVRAAERIFSGAILATGTHILRGRYHPGITVKTRVLWTDRSGVVHTANVLDFDDTEGAGVETVVLASEQYDV